jgi:hypothetical protein
VSGLSADLAACLGLLLTEAVLCERMLRHFAPRRPPHARTTAIVLLLIVTVPLVLANLSFDVSPPKVAFGWPMIWYWHTLITMNPRDSMPSYHGWDYSALRLGINLLIWLLALAGASAAWEWLLRRYRPQLRWSLRTMLLTVGLLAAICAWVAAARVRADKQDALIAWVRANRGSVYVNRCGPVWFDQVGADRYRRRIVGAELKIKVAEDAEKERFKQLAKLRGLHFLDITFPALGTGMPAALREMRCLRTLRVDCGASKWDDSDSTIQECVAALGSLRSLERLCFAGWFEMGNDGAAELARLENLKSLTIDVNFANDEQRARECLAAVGKLTQVEQLSLTGWPVRRDDLTLIGTLTNLRSLTIDSIEVAGNEHQSEGHIGEPSALAHFPVLPRLESLCLREPRIGDQDLDRLAVLPRLKSLCLAFTNVSDAGLRKLAALHSLEVLTIDEGAATAEGLDALVSLRGLREIHLAQPQNYQADRSASLPLDDGEEMAVLPSELDGARRALKALRQTHPEIVIDTDDACFYGSEWEWTGRPTSPWDRDQMLDRGLSSFRRQLMQAP